MSRIFKPKNSTKKRTIVGRGASSKGRACGRGHDGQKSRSGGGVRPGFEGGQMPLYRRVARRGFSNARYKVEYQAINLSRLCDFFKEDETVTLDELRERNVIKGQSVAKILAGGELAYKLNISGLRLSEAAKTAIEAKGGKVTE